MRGFVYVIAVVASIGIAYSIATSPSQPASTPAGLAQSDVATQTLTIAVPDMMCEFACFPKVKESLEAADGVRSVQLAKQKEEGTLDNKQVIVTHDDRLDVKAAINRLVQAGFENSKAIP